MNGIIFSNYTGMEKHQPERMNEKRLPTPGEKAFLMFPEVDGNANLNILLPKRHFRHALHHFGSCGRV